VDSVAEVITADAERQEAREAQIPTTILVVLILYSLIAAAVLGNVMRNPAVSRSRSHCLRLMFWL
jgi:hypothetical protein